MFYIAQKYVSKALIGQSRDKMEKRPCLSLFSGSTRQIQFENQLKLKSTD